MFWLDLKTMQGLQSISGINSKKAFIVFRYNNYTKMLPLFLNTLKVTAQAKAFAVEKNIKMVCAGDVHPQRTPFFGTFLSRTKQLPFKNILGLCNSLQNSQRYNIIGESHE
jgi:hypothetical protein